jgi:hypothetical protein
MSMYDWCSKLWDPSYPSQAVPSGDERVRLSRPCDPLPCDWGCNMLSRTFPFWRRNLTDQNKVHGWERSQNVEDWMGRLTVGGWDFYRRIISAISLQIRRWKGEHLYCLSVKWESCSYIASVGYSFVEKMKRKRQFINAFDLFRKWNQILQYSKLLMIINIEVFRILHQC